MDNEKKTVVSLPDAFKASNFVDLDDYHIYEDSNMGVGIDRRVIYVVGEINGIDEAGPCTTTNEVVNQIQRWNMADEKQNIPVEQRKPIWISIASEGGDLLGTWVLVNAIKGSKTPVYTVNVNHALSAACLILVSGHKRFSLRGAGHLIHSGSVRYSGQKENADSMKKYMDKIDKKATDWLISATKIDSKTYKTRAPKDWWMDEDDALKYGLIDEIVDDLNKIFY